jgi:hypothetical protein
MKGRAGRGKFAKASMRTTSKLAITSLSFTAIAGSYDPRAEKVQMDTRIVTCPAYGKM